MVAIIGVLAAVAIPAYNGYRNTAAENAAKSEASEIMKALQACVTVESTTPLTTCYDTDVNGTLSKTCTISTLSAKATATGCHLKNSGTAGCASATVQGVGSFKHYCIQVNTTSGQVNTTNTGADKYCKSDGTCA